MEPKNLLKDIKKVINSIKRFDNKFIIYMIMNEYNKKYDLKEINDKLYYYLTNDIKLSNNDIKKNIKFINIIVKDDIKEEDKEDKQIKKGRKKKYQSSYYDRHKESIKKYNLERYYYNKSKKDIKEDIKEDNKE